MGIIKIISIKMHKRIIQTLKKIQEKKKKINKIQTIFFLFFD